MTVDEMAKQIISILSDREPVVSKQLADVWIKRFAPKILQKIIEDYPFMIQKYALQPLNAGQKITIWEKHLFSSLDEKTAKFWRAKRRIEIEKFTDDQIMEDITRIKKLIEKKLADQREAEKAKAAADIQGQMMDELKNKIKNRTIPEENPQEEEDQAMLQLLLSEDTNERIEDF